MKVNQDRRVKASVLSLALDRYESSPKFNNDQVPQEMQLEIITRYERKAEGPFGRREKSKDKPARSGEKRSEAEEEQTEEDLLAMCSSLTSRIQSLKQQKYDHVVEQFQCQQRRKLAGVLEAEGRKNSERYAGLRKELLSSHDQEKLKIAKALEDVKKFKQAYKTMLDELEEKKSKINAEYQHSLSILKDQKERLIAEWKRNSNEELFKLGFKGQ